MKPIILILFLFLLSCEKNKKPEICVECREIHHPAVWTVADTLKGNCGTPDEVYRWRRYMESLRVGDSIRYICKEKQF